MTRFDLGPEEGVMLASGDIVIGALYEVVRHLLDLGHTITVPTIGDVIVG